MRHEGRTVPSALLKSERCSSGVEARVGFMAELPPLAFAAYSISAALEPAAPRAGVTLDVEELRVTTPFLEARLDPHGELRRWWINAPDGSLSPGKRSGFFAGRINGKDCESQGKWTLPGRGGKTRGHAREYGFIGDIPYTLEIRFRSDTSRLDCRVSFTSKVRKSAGLAMIRVMPGRASSTRTNSASNSFRRRTGRHRRARFAVRDF